MKTIIKNKIKTCCQVSQSLEWATSLLKDIGDKENLAKVEEISKTYSDIAFNIMRENNIEKIEVDVTRTKALTLSIKKTS